MGHPRLIRFLADSGFLLSRFGSRVGMTKDDGLGRPGLRGLW
jgi:hypothetical protein